MWTTYFVYVFLVSANTILLKRVNVHALRRELLPFVLAVFFNFADFGIQESKVDVLCHYVLNAVVIWSYACLLMGSTFGGYRVALAHPAPFNFSVCKFTYFCSKQQAKRHFFNKTCGYLLKNDHEAVATLQTRSHSQQAKIFLADNFSKVIQCCYSFL